MSPCSGRSGGPYLAAAPAPVVPAHDVLVVLVLLGQVVEEHALGHRLKQEEMKKVGPGRLTPRSGRDEERGRGNVPFAPGRTRSD